MAPSLSPAQALRASPSAPRAVPRAAGAGAGLLVAFGAGLAAMPAAAQQAPAPPAAAPAGPPPTVAEALAFVNQTLTARASEWRPCRSTAKVELVADGTLTLTLTRASYCEDVRIIANVHELDAAALTVEVADEALLRLPCLQEAPCARAFQKRKRFGGEAEGWVARDADWVPGGPLGAEHQSTAVELSMASRAADAQQVADALGFLVRAAVADPGFQRPARRFDAQAAAPAAPSAN